MIDSIIEQMYEYKKWYTQVYGEFATYNGNSEGYDDACHGAIDEKLVEELRLPIDVPDGKTIEFDSSTAYGLSNGRVHNGVDLTSASAGVNAGDSVYAVADGTVEKIEKDSSSSKKSSNKTQSTSSSISNYLFIGDSRYSGLSSKLSEYGKVAAVVSSNSTQWSSVTKSGSGTILGTSISLPASVNGVSVMLGVNDMNIEKLQEVLEIYITDIHQ